MSLPAGGTSELVDQLLAEADAGGEAGIPLGKVIDRFSRRAFGGLVLFLTLPAFIPLGLGFLFGPLLALVGLQMILQYDHPWMPARVRAYAIPRQRLQRLSQRLGNGLRRVERIARPRWNWCAEGPGQMLSGISVIVLGTLLALPIPLTNWPFGILLCLFALGLIERDGLLIVFGWCCAAACIVLIIAAVNGLVDGLPAVSDWIEGWGQLFL